MLCEAPVTYTTSTHRAAWSTYCMNVPQGVCVCQAALYGLAKYFSNCSSRITSWRSSEVWTSAPVIKVVKSLLIFSKWSKLLTIRFQHRFIDIKYHGFNQLLATTVRNNDKLLKKPPGPCTVCVSMHLQSTATYQRWRGVSSSNVTTRSRWTDWLNLLNQNT